MAKGNFTFQLINCHYLPLASPSTQRTSPSIIKPVRIFWGSLSVTLLFLFFTYCEVCVLCNTQATVWMPNKRNVGPPTQKLRCPTCKDSWKLNYTICSGKLSEKCSKGQLELFHDTSKNMLVLDDLCVIPHIDWYLSQIFCTTSSHSCYPCLACMWQSGRDHMPITQKRGTFTYDIYYMDKTSQLCQLSPAIESTGATLDTLFVVCKGHSNLYHRMNHITLLRGILK